MVLILAYPSTVSLSHRLSSLNVDAADGLRSMSLRDIKSGFLIAALLTFWTRLFFVGDY